MARIGSADVESEWKSGKRHAETEQGSGQAPEELPTEPAEEERVVNPNWERTAHALIPNKWNSCEIEKWDSDSGRLLSLPQE